MFHIYIINIFLNSHSEGGVHIGSTRHVGHYWLIVPAPDDYDDGEFCGMKIGRGNRSTRRKPAPAPLCPPQFPLARSGLEPGPPRYIYIYIYIYTCYLSTYKTLHAQLKLFINYWKKPKDKYTTNSRCLPSYHFTIYKNINYKTAIHLSKLCYHTKFHNYI
jgi:hypothetical protein